MYKRDYTLQLHKGQKAVSWGTAVGIKQSVKMAVTINTQLFTLHSRIVGYDSQVSQTLSAVMENILVSNLERNKSYSGTI